MPYKEYLQLRTNMADILHINEMRIIQTVNDHAYLYLTAILSDDYKDDYVKRVNAQEQIEVFIEESTHHTLFKGIIQRRQVKSVNDIFYLHLEGVSNSFKADIKKQYRSFQDRNMTYKQMIEDIIKNYNGGDIADKASNGKPIGNFILQYRETDWEFLKRMASHFNMGILPVITFEEPKLVFGIPDGKDIGEIDAYNYSISKNIAQFMKSSQNTNPDLDELDALEFEIDTDNDCQIGDKVKYQNISLYIKSKETEIRKGNIHFNYILSTKNGLGQDKLYNEQIAGISLKGRVLQAVRDKVKVHLEVDQEQDVAKAWEFSYTTMYTAEGNSGWYCMPEINDTVFIYFPTKEEHMGVGMNSIRVLNKPTDKITSPDTKYFRTIDGKELKFSPEEILITCVNGKNKETGEEKVIYIRLNQETGIEIVSTEPIAFKSEKGISMQAKEAIKILSEQQIRLKCKTSEIVIDSKIDICGKDVKIN